MKIFPSLFKKDSKGKIRIFKVKIFNAGKSYCTKTGLSGGQLIEREYSPTAKGKNTVIEQVEKDAQSKWNKKYERELYSKDLDKPHPLAFIQPMLAKDYTKVPHQVNWVKNTYVAQRKLNGVRCVATYDNSRVSLTSRKGKKYTALAIEKTLLEQVFINNPNVKIDGELYIHGVELGDVTTAVAHSLEHPELEYHAFDLVDETVCFENRHKKLKSFHLSGLLKCVDYDRVIDEQELYSAHDKYVQAGFEGAMLRDLNGLYEIGKRSLTLFKRKTFQDDEFTIVDVDIDSEGGAVLILKNIADVQFRSRPMGTNEFRKKLLNNKVHLIGEKVTVKYSELLATGVPEFNRTLQVGILRNYE